MANWTKEQDDYLLDNYKSDSIEILIRNLNKSENAIRWRASYLGITKPKSKGWSDSELKLLKSGLSNFEISNKIGRSVKAIVSQKHKLNLVDKSSKYLESLEISDIVQIDEDIPFVMDTQSKSMQYFKVLSTLEIGQSFEYPSNEHSIVRNQIILFEHKTFATKKWSDDTRRVWLLDERKKTTIIQSQSVNKKKTWTDEDSKQLKKLISRYSHKEIAKILGFSVGTIYNKSKNI